MGKPICNVMIDLETLAIDPRAAVIQAGIVYTNLLGEVEGWEFNCSPLQYRENLAGGKAGAKGDENFVLEQNTINFHHKENPHNFELCVQSNTSLQEFANDIRNTIELAKADGKYAIWLWSCGTDFDIPILCNLFKHAGIKPNWSYSNVRDYRTLREIYKEQVPKAYKNDHSALGDARNQYLHLMEILDYIELQKSAGKGFGEK